MLHAIGLIDAQTDLSLDTKHAVPAQINDGFPAALTDVVLGSSDQRPHQSINLHAC